MKVRFEEEIGIVPVLRRFEADSNTMPPPLVDVLRTFMERHAGERPDAPYPDQGALRVMTEEDGVTASVSLPPSSIPAEAQGLFQYFRAEAKPVPLA